MKLSRFYIILTLILITFLTVSCTGREDNAGNISIHGVNTDSKTFRDTGDEICTEDGKPIIREFSTTWCPHCTWIKESYNKVVKEYEGQIVAYHWELDMDDNALTPEVEGEIPTSEMDIFNKYNPKSSIPTFVFGCKYARVGNGYESQGNLEAEEAEFRQIIEELIAS
jgi:thiol-disulfide isomerase/thioredoxin